MDAAPVRPVTRPAGRDPLAGRAGSRAATGAEVRPGGVAAAWRERLAALRVPVVAYLATRALLLLVAVVNTGIQHAGFSQELTNWDGFWYLEIVQYGYPHHVAGMQTTLGFFPLYPLVIFAVKHVLFSTDSFAGLVVSGVGGLVSSILVYRLAERWWGTAAAKRAAVVFCLFPGSVVFSMTYSEGLLVPLAAGCLLALERRRFLLAGLLAGAATAVGPAALALVPACALASLLELRRSGWHSPDGPRSLLAPLLAPAGAVAFAAYLWAWAGSPLATFQAQRRGWNERTDPAALLHQAQALARELELAPQGFHVVNLNLVAGLAGAAVLAVGIYLLARRDNRIPAAPLAFALGVGLLAATSEYTPPNPRLLITAFPVVLVLAKRCTGRAYVALAVVNGVLLAVMSAVTFVGIALRP